MPSGADTEVPGSPLVLCYHGVSSTWPALLATSADRLEAQLRSVLERGYTPVTFREAMSGGLGDRTFAVTFDDACRSVIEQAFPLMRELGVPGTVYAPTSFVGSDQPMSWPGVDRWLGTEHEAELLCMSWRQLEELAGEGWEVGSHTRAHPELTTLGDDELAAELGESRAVLADRLGGGQTLAFPYGDNDRRVQEASRTAGYEAAAGLRPGPRSRWCWPRVGVYPTDDEGRFERKTGTASRALRESRLGGALYGIKRRARPR